MRFARCFTGCSETRERMADSLLRVDYHEEAITVLTPEGVRHFRGPYRPLSARQQRRAENQICPREFSQF